jgi:predicted TIM-barrel fold metal-dependent hydrolase
MAIVIDVDAHFEPGDDWLSPYPKLAARLPKLDPARLAVHTICGDLLHDVPEDRRPPMAELLPPGLLTLFGQEKAAEKERRAEFEGKNQFQVANAQARLKWIDEQGIDVQNVICLAGITYGMFLDDKVLRQEAIGTANSWLADTCAASAGRLLPVTALDFSDLDWVVAELTRMRRHGSRIFLIPAYPVDGVPPIHPSWDKVWRTATELGMVAMVHTGFEHMRFDPGWANLGGPGGCDVTLLRQIGGSHRHVAPMTLLNGMVYSGVFERFPTLTVLLAEVGVGWLPFLYREIDDRISPTAQLFLGKWSLPLKPSEYLARNVKGTPLSAGNDSPLLRIMDELPEDMIVFSSDFPHFEGFADPKAYYAEALAALPAPRRERFFGGTMADVFRRMGDPIG